ncbi:MAG: S24 family peptidase, partial [Phycisphaerales bacterium]
VARWDRTPSNIRADLTQLRRRDEHARLLANLLASSARSGASLDQLYASGELRAVIDRIAPEDEDQKGDQGSGDGGGRAGGAGGGAMALMLPMEVPLINKVTAGYPADFTDMGYPARIGDEYIRTPDLHDPDAFAARVVGDSMEPTYREGDIVVFSPAREVVDGTDCFVRLEPDHESTFKRVYFERGDGGEEMIRIQPINNRYGPRTVPREQVAGLYAGVSVTRSIG